MIRSAHGFTLRLGRTVRSVTGTLARRVRYGGKVAVMIKHCSAPGSATQTAVWVSADELARIQVCRQNVRDDRGAMGWSYSFGYAGPEDVNGDRVGYHRTFAAPGDLIYMPGNEGSPLVALDCLAGYLDAWAEALRHPSSDNRDIFPMSVIELADYADEFACDVAVDFAEVYRNAEVAS